MRIKMTWPSACNYGKEYDVELLKRSKSYYSSGHLMDDGIKVRFNNGWETFIEMWRVEIMQATPAERAMINNPVIRQW